MLGYQNRVKPLGTVCIKLSTASNDYVFCSDYTVFYFKNEGVNFQGLMSIVSRSVLRYGTLINVNDHAERVLSFDKRGPVYQNGRRLHTMMALVKHCRELGE